MAHHPSPIVIHIVGTEVADDDRSCKEHVCCGAEVLDEDVVVRLRKVQVVVDGRVETAVALFGSPRSNTSKFNGKAHLI